MSPKTADPNVRTALVEAAARLLTDEGPAALTTRRLAREVGASTMVVYTHFGGMAELRTAMSLEGFRRLARHLADVELTDDPVADVAGLGRAYRENALANPSLYQVMFGTHPDGWMMDPADLAMTLSTFETLVHAVQRCVDAKRFHDGDAWAMSSQVWAGAHGVVMLELSGFLGPAEAIRTIQDIASNLFVGFGDDPTLVLGSMAAAVHD